VFFGLREQGEKELQEFIYSPFLALFNKKVYINIFSRTELTEKKRIQI